MDNPILFQIRKAMDASDSGAAMGQLFLRCGGVLMGAVIEIDSKQVTMVGAVPKNPQDPRMGFNLVEQYVLTEQVVAFVTEASEATQAAYKKLWDGPKIQVPQRKNGLVI
jgi:hypothetical protein